MALIVGATFLVYGPALRNGFVWDDTALVLRDPLIRSWRLIPEAFGHFLFLDATASDFYRPMQRLTFTADYALHGFGAPWGWHLTSIALHAAAAVALYFLARKFLSNGEALAVALVWAVHPLHTSAVTYVAGRADLLAALFGFSALALALRERMWPAVLCFFAALLSKESGIGALLVWMLLLAWRRAGWKIAARWIALSVLMLGGYFALRLSAEHTPPPPSAPAALADRPILAARALAEYAGLVILPRTLRMERDVREREWLTWPGVLLLLGFAAWWWRVPRAAPMLAAFALAYLPISNLFSLNATVAEHWLYVPAAFLFLAVALSVRPSWGMRAVLAGWFAFLGVRTFLRQADWRDQRTFLTRTIADGGDTARMQMNLGNVEWQDGHADLAVAHYREALRRAPEQAMAWMALANVSVGARDFATAREALGHAEKSALLAPDILKTRAALEYLETGRDSGELLRQAVALAPKDWPIRRRHLEHLDETGRTAEAARELRDFLSAQSFRAESWALLSRLLGKLGHGDAAAAAWREAQRRDVRLTR